MSCYCADMCRCLLEIRAASLRCVHWQEMLISVARTSAVLGHIFPQEVALMAAVAGVRTHPVCLDSIASAAQIKFEL